MPYTLKIITAWNPNLNQNSVLLYATASIYASAAAATDDTDVDIIIFYSFYVTAWIYYLLLFLSNTHTLDLSL